MIAWIVYALLIGGAAAQVEVTPLVEEWALDEMLNVYTLVTWSTFIRDGDDLIIVDLPPNNETALEKKFNDAMKERNLTPQVITKVVSTHGHPKNFGHNSAFPNAHQFFSTYEHNGKTFLRTGLYENGRMQLSPNVQLWYTPGNAPEDITVMVTNVPNRGIVAITGNLIFDSNDVLEPSSWEKKAQHLHAGIKRRRKVICHANYVIPGHGPIFAVTDQHRDAVKCQEKREVNDGLTEEQKRRRRQHQYEYPEQDRFGQHLRNQQVEHQRNIDQWQQQERERRQQLSTSNAESLSSQNSYGSGDCCAQQPCQANQPMCSTTCCTQQPCQANQPMCSSGCCSQPPCQPNQPPCTFASTCCSQQQSCAWNQLKCQTNCQPRQSCSQPAAPVQCGHTETHHHYIAAEQEIFHTHIRNEQSGLVTMLNDQQKQIRADQDKVNQILLDYIGDMSSSIQQWLDESRSRDRERSALITRQKQEKANMEERHARELAELNDRPPQTPLDLRQDKVLRALEEHKRTSDQWWLHQKQVEETKRAQEEVTYKKVLKTPARNYSTTTTVKREPCAAQPAPQTQTTSCCTSGCDNGCTQQGCNTGCAQGCNTGCAQGCNTGCAQGCNTGCTNLPGQRQYVRRRLRRHEAKEERRQRRLEWLRTSQVDEEARNERNEDSK